VSFNENTPGRAERMLRWQLDVRTDRDAWRDQAQAGQRLLSFDKSSGPPDCKPWWRRHVSHPPSTLP